MLMSMAIVYTYIGCYVAVNFHPVNVCDECLRCCDTDTVDCQEGMQPMESLSVNIQRFSEEYLYAFSALTLLVGHVVMASSL